MAIYNATKQTVIARSCKVAATFWRRLKGLLGTRELPADEAILIMPCSSVHTFGMNYPIDVIFVSKNNQVLKTVNTMKPGRIKACSGSSYVVEVPAGTVIRTCTGTGDILEYR